MAARANKKKARKELKLSDVVAKTQELFAGPRGCDESESGKSGLAKQPVKCWAWREAGGFGARSQSQLVIPTRWVRSNKHDGLVGKEFLGKSRLIVQRIQGPFSWAVPARHPNGLGSGGEFMPGSLISNSCCLRRIHRCVFSGKEGGREIYREPPRGGLPGLRPGH